MRRRRVGRRELTAEQVVAIVRAAAPADASLEVRNQAVREALAKHGYTPLDAFRARYWLRLGAPAGYSWNQR